MPFPPLPELARWLSQRFSRPPVDYQGGREEIVRALVAHLDCASAEAERLLDDLERAGHLRYAAEARSPGGSPGAWVVYVSPAENPDDESLDRAVSDTSAGAATRRDSESDPDA